MAVEIEEYQIKFEYIRGIKNTLTNSMIRLIKLDPNVSKKPEPEVQEYG